MLIMKLFSAILGFGMGGLGGGGVNPVQTPTSGGFGGGVSTAALANTLPGVRRVPGESGLGSSGVTQNINLVFKEPMDAYSFDNYIKRSGGTIKKIVADGIDESIVFKKQVRGK